GPQIARIEPEFITVEGEPVKADERYFLVRVDHDRIDTSRHTVLEQLVMTQHRWFTMQELSSWHELVFPTNLADLIKA
ncbi:MAG: DNA mismatch repair protein MutT, partial [Pseudomonadota bacterium]